MPPDPDSGLGQFLGAFKTQVGGDLGNYFAGYRDMQGQIAQTREKNAQADDLSAQAAQRKMQMESQKRQGQILQQQAQQRKQALNSAESFIQNEFDQAAALIEGGEPAAGAALIDKAMKASAQLATVKREQDTREGQQFARGLEKTEFEDRLWTGVHDETSQAAAAVQWAENAQRTGQQGEMNPFDIPFSPEDIQTRRETSKAGLAWMKAQREEQETKAKLENWKRLTKESDHREKYLDETIKLRKEAAARVAKSAGVVKPAGLDLRAQAEDLLSDRFPDLTSKERRVFGFELANRAMGITTTNRGVDEADALNRAIKERQSELKTLNDHYKETSGLAGFFSFLHSDPPKEPGEGEDAGPGAKPIVGKVFDGHRFLGGDPSKKSSWKPVEPGEEDEGREADVESEESAEAFAARQEQ